MSAFSGIAISGIASPDYNGFFEWSGKDVANLTWVQSLRIADQLDVMVRQTTEKTRPLTGPVWMTIHTLD